jgi:caa(3)-type oxidase subunit IV
MSEHRDHHEGHDVDYKKIYFILLGLLAVSVAGPFVGIVWVTLITAFGIAIVKARLVINNFMHLKWEKRLMKWMLTTSLLLIGLLVAGVAPDVMNHEGSNWENLAAREAVERGVGGAHGEDEGEAAGSGGDAAAAAGESAAGTVAEAGGFNVEAAFASVCGACHGVAGDGSGAAGALMNPRPADFTDPAFWEGRDLERIVTVIRDGAVAVGGSPLMTPWRASYDEEQIQGLAEYILTFRPND